MADELVSVSMVVENDNVENVSEVILGFHDLLPDEMETSNVNNIGNSKPSNETSRTRSRFKDSSNWNVNVQKKKRALGLEYTNRKGELRPAKQPRIMEACDCRFKCHESIKPEQQISLLQNFLALGDTSRQKAYLSQFIDERPVSRKRPRKHETKREKTVSRYYHLPSVQNDGELMRVCLRFFTSLFQVSPKYLDTITTNRSSTGTFLGVNHGRREQRPSTATSPARIQIVKDHIKQFPAMPSHNCRADSRKLYLSPELNIKTMYRLYRDYVGDLQRSDQAETEPVSEYVYRDIFNKLEPPIAFYQPKKDQCSKCAKFKETPTPSEAETTDFEMHKKREKDSLEMKKIDMNSDDENQRTVTFDSEATLYLPQSQDNLLYYQRKLSVFNFTIFDSTKQGFCYVFDEVNGHKGCSEIASCILRYLSTLPDGISVVNTWSGTCSAQNRNHYLVAALIYAVNNSSHLKQVNVKYLETGHANVECDSMHARVEAKKKHRKLFTTDQIVSVIEEARVKPGPYHVQHLSFREFWDMESLASKSIKNYTIDENGEVVKWMRIKWLQINKGEEVVKFKYNYDGQFHEFNFRHRPSNSEQCRTEIALTPAEIGELQLENLHSEKLPISSAKKKDLLSLVRAGVIGPSHENFYADIPCSSRVTDSCEVVELIEDPDLLLMYSMLVTNPNF